MSSPRPTLRLYLSTVSEIVSSPRPTLRLYLSTVSEIVSSPMQAYPQALSFYCSGINLCSVLYAGLDMEILRRRGNLSHSEWTLYTCSGWAVSCTVILLLLTVPRTPLRMVLLTRIQTNHLIPGNLVNKLSNLSRSASSCSE